MTPYLYNIFIKIKMSDKSHSKGSIELVTGTYNATAVAGGYDPSTLSPSSITIIDETDTGDPDTGVQIIGAKFVRTDSTGTINGPEISTNDDGNAIFNNVPFADSGSNKIYYKQISGDGGHTFDDTVKSITMTEESETVEITNPESPIRNFTLMDASFPIFQS